MKALCSIFSILLALQSGLSAQTMTSVSSRWSDSFVEWEIFAVWQDSSGNAIADSLAMADPEEFEGENEGPEEEFYGDLKLRWLNVKDDFSEWDFSLGERRGTVRQKWKDDPTQWELRTYDGDVITMRASWPNDLTEWRITNNNTTLTFKSRWTNQLDEWLAKDPNYGLFYFYTLRSRDPRDWAIEDKLVPGVSEAMKMAMIFIALFHSSPKQ